MSIINLKQCTKADIPTLVKVGLQSYKEHYTYLWKDDGAVYINNNFTENAFNRELENPNAAVFLIYYENEAVGFLKLNINQGLDDLPKTMCLELEKVYLLKKVAGKGIGRQVVNFVLDFARERNKKIIWLKSMDSSPSVQFYDKVGFERFGTMRLSFSSMKEEYRNMIIFKIDL